MRALLAGLLMSGCYKIDYLRDVPAAPAPSLTSWHHIGIFGLVEFSDPVPLQNICPTGFSRVHQEVSPMNALVIALLTIPTVTALGWTYQPSTISVYCNSGQAFDVEVNREGIASGQLG